MPSRAYMLALQKALARKHYMKHARWLAVRAEAKKSKEKEPEALVIARDLAARIAPHSGGTRALLIHVLTPQVISHLKNPQPFPPLSRSKRDRRA